MGRRTVKIGLAPKDGLSYNELDQTPRKEEVVSDDGEERYNTCFACSSEGLIVRYKRPCKLEYKCKDCGFYDLREFASFDPR